MSALHDALVRHIPELRRYARALTRNSTDADDLVQDCMARILEKSPPWRRVQNPRAYLFSVMHNIYVDQVNGAYTELSANNAKKTPFMLVVKPVQYDRLVLQDLENALQQLSPDQREVVLLVGLQGMTYREVADILNVPVGTVMSRLSRAREALRKMMDEENDSSLRQAQ